ncbi:MAG: hypothetical protein WCC86_07800 [Methanoregula sp.]
MPMIGLYRIHQEQIKKVEQSLKAPFQIHKGDTGTGNPQVKKPEHMRQKSLSGERELGRNVSGNKRVCMDPPTPPSSPVPALRCLRCNTRMPELDFLYTNKSGLCICCWEEQEACI